MKCSKCTITQSTGPTYTAAAIHQSACCHETHNNNNKHRKCIYAYVANLIRYNMMGQCWSETPAMRPHFSQMVPSLREDFCFSAFTEKQHSSYTWSQTVIACVAGIQKASALL